MTHRTASPARPSIALCLLGALALGAVLASLLLLHGWASERAAERAASSEAVSAALGASDYSAPRTLSASPAAYLGTGSSAPVIEEDSPLWNCATMGNRVCGPMGSAPVTAPAQSEAYAQRDLAAQLASPAACRLTGSILAPTFTCD